MRACIAVFLVAVVLFATPVLADKEPPELSEYDRHDLRVTAICIESHVVIVAHSDVGNSGGLDMMQLEQEVDGRIVPIRCNETGALLSQEQLESASPGSTPERQGKDKAMGR